MANEEHLAILRQGVEAWNMWRREHWDISPALRGAGLRGIDLGRANLRKADLRDADLRGANLCATDVRGGKLLSADLRGTNLCGADLRWAILRGANFRKSDLRGAQLVEADLGEANLHRVDLRRANLRGANLEGALLADARLEMADLTACRAYGISAWDLNLEGAQQADIIITRADQPKVTVDNIEVAQFLYLLLNNKKVRDVIDTVTSKAVLIFGRFTLERKAVLDVLREELRRRGYLPILFDFEKPASKDLTGTIQTLANLARFVIADLTDPSSVPHELAMVVPGTAVPVQPVLLEGQPEYAMFVDLKRRYGWVLEPYRYASPDTLMADLSERVIAPAEAKARELRAVRPAV